MIFALERNCREFRKKKNLTNILYRNTLLWHNLLMVSRSFMWAYKFTPESNHWAGHDWICDTMVLFAPKSCNLETDPCGNSDIKFNICYVLFFFVFVLFNAKTQSFRSTCFIKPLTKHFLVELPYCYGLLENRSSSCCRKRGDS